MKLCFVGGVVGWSLFPLMLVYRFLSTVHGPRSTADLFSDLRFTKYDLRGLWGSRGIWSWLRSRVVFGFTIYELRFTRPLGELRNLVLVASSV